eukprot:Rmarinus@m.8342
MASLWQRFSLDTSRTTFTCIHLIMDLLQKRKKDNWAQLQKFFRKRPPLCDHISPVLIQGVMDCHENASVQLLSLIYELLTDRKLKAVPGPSAEEIMPAYAKPTAAQLVHESLKTTDDQQVSTHELSAKAANVIEGHRENLRREREVDPERFQAPPRQRTQAVRGSPRKLGKETVAPQVSFQDVNVRPIERSIGEIRSMRDLKGGGSQLNVDGSMDLKSASNLAVGVTSAPPVLTLLNRMITGSAAGRYLHDDDEGGGDTASAFVHAVLANTIPAPDVVSTFEDLTRKVTDIADSCVASPGDFFRIFSIFMPLLQTQSPQAFPHVGAFLLALGQTMVTRDPLQTRALFLEYALGLFVPILTHTPQKRRALLEIAYAFVGDGIPAHINFIKALHQKIGAMDVFVQCMAILILLERRFDADLLDLYVYYCVFGTRVVSPSVRAAALSMLPIVVAQDPRIVVHMLNYLFTLLSDPWWEVKAQLLLTFCALVPHVSDSGPNPGQRSRLLAATRELLESRTSNVQKIGLCALARLSEDREIARLFVGFLLRYPVHLRRPLLAEQHSEVVQVLGCTIGTYEYPAVTQSWDPLAVCEMLVEHAEVGGEGGAPLGNLETPHWDVFQAAVSRSFQREKLHQWAEVLVRSKLYLYVGLSDSDHYVAAIEILQAFAKQLPRADLLETFETAQSGLVMVFKDSSSACHQGAIDLLSSFAAIPDLSQDVRSLVRSVLDNGRNFVDQEGKPLAGFQVRGRICTHKLTHTAYSLSGSSTAQPNVVY